MIELYGPSLHPLRFIWVQSPHGSWSQDLSIYRPVQYPEPYSSEDIQRMQAAEIKRLRKMEKKGA